LRRGDGNSVAAFEAHVTVFALFETGLDGYDALAKDEDAVLVVGQVGGVGL
jgi:hypothetical protein